jgi:glycosyltransferase involved in cell wall biosynthesis
MAQENRTSVAPPAEPVTDQRDYRVSVVIPVYNGASSIRQLVERLGEELSSRFDLEVVLVNDASPDDSEEICRSLALSNDWVRFVNLARNFGEHNAVMAGLSYCTGDCAVIVDDDFQNPPSEVAKLVTKLREGHDIVFSRYEVKHHHPLRNLGSRFNNTVASVLLSKDRSLYLSSFKAINRFLIDEILKYSGPYPYIDGLVLRTTNRYATQLVEHRPRRDGESNYTIPKLVHLWLNMFTNFSILPLRLASLLGLAVAVLGGVAAVTFVIEYLQNPNLPVGWSSLAVLLMVLAGVQLFALGMIGEYLGRLFLKDNETPMYVARETINCEKSASAVEEPGARPSVPASARSSISASPGNE